jgi:hypothetical protein
MEKINGAPINKGSGQLLDELDEAFRGTGLDVLDVVRVLANNEQAEKSLTEMVRRRREVS